MRPCGDPSARGAHTRSKETAGRTAIRVFDFALYKLPSPLTPYHFSTTARVPFTGKVRAVPLAACRLPLWPAPRCVLLVAPFVALAAHAQRQPESVNRGPELPESVFPGGARGTPAGLRHAVSHGPTAGLWGGAERALALQHHTTVRGVDCSAVAAGRPLTLPSLAVALLLRLCSLGRQAPPHLCCSRGLRTTIRRCVSSGCVRVGRNLPGEKRPAPHNALTR